MTMMRNVSMGRRVMAIVAALLVALLGASGVVFYAQHADARAVAGQATQRVLIAQAPVPQGTTARDALARKLIVAQTVVSRGVPVGALSEVTGTTASLVATSAISAGEIVLASRFGQPTKQVAPTGPVPDGQIAITVNLPDPERIAPLLAPGSHIVIYDTFNPRKSAPVVPDGGKLQHAPPLMRATRVLFDDVSVIAVGSAQVRSPGTSTPSGTPTPAPSTDAAAVPSALVTVALPPAEALRLVHAVQTGTLYCGLRGARVTVDHKALINDTTVLGK
jgi:pilus assembly protein CpaB